MFSGPLVTIEELRDLVLLLKVLDILRITYLRMVLIFIFLCYNVTCGQPASAPLCPSTKLRSSVGCCCHVSLASCSHHSTPWSSECTCIHDTVSIISNSGQAIDPINTDPGYKTWFERSSKNKDLNMDSLSLSTVTISCSDE